MDPDAVRTELATTGVVRLPGALTGDQAAAMRATVWRFIEGRSETRLADPTTWVGNRPQVSYKPLKGRQVFAPIIDNPSVQAALGAIFGEDGWQPPKRPGAQILISFPRSGPWVLPGDWHMDCGFEQPTWPIPAVRIFGFFDDVGPEGGGTLVMKGSHRLVERYVRTIPPGTPGNSQTWQRFMKHDPWLQQLARGGTPEDPRRELLDAPHDVGGIEVEAVELTGRAGDLVLTHLHVFHTAAPNTSTRPRQMLGHGIAPRRDAPVPAPVSPAT